MSSLDLWHEEAGDPAGPLVALVHGAMDRAASFLKVVKRVPSVRTLRYARRGYGRAPKPSPGVALGAHVDDLLDLLAGRPSAVLGHSYGGLVALGAALRRPDVVRAVAVYEPPMSWEPWWPATTAGADAVASEAGAADAAERFLRRMLGDRGWEALPARVREERRSEGEALVAELADLRRGAPFDLGAVTVPVVCARGGRSLPHLHRAAGEVAALVPGAELVELPEADHGAHLSRPDEVAELVLRLGGLSPAGGTPPAPRPAG